MINIAGEELKGLKDEIDEVSLEQRQGDKDMQSQWIQTKMMIDGQKHENQNLLKQLIELKKQYSILRSQISICDAKVKELRGQVG